MKDVLDFSKDGANDIIKYIENCDGHYIVIDIQDNKLLRNSDVDLLVVNTKNMDDVRICKVEIKTDRYYFTGNYFFETISNKNKNTKGCFLYTKADYLYYYFRSEKELHIIPVKKTREWFLKNQNRFETKYTSTKGDNGLLYMSEGKIVPRKVVMKEVEGIQVRKLI